MKVKNYFCYFQKSLLKSFLKSVLIKSLHTQEDVNCDVCNLKINYKNFVFEIFYIIRNNQIEEQQQKIKKKKKKMQRKENKRLKVKEIRDRKIALEIYPSSA